jgi:hypothetical protein
MHDEELTSSKEDLHPDYVLECPAQCLPRCIVCKPFVPVIRKRSEYAEDFRPKKDAEHS